MYLDGTPKVLTCGADPAAVLGVAAEGAEDVIEPGYIIVWEANEDTIFAFQGDNAPTAADVNTQMGAAVDGDGVWYFDGTDGSNVVFYCREVDIPAEFYLVRILAAVRQSNPIA